MSIPHLIRGARSVRESATYKSNTRLSKHEMFIAAVRVRVRQLACHMPRHGCIFHTTLHQSLDTRAGGGGGGGGVNSKPKRLLLLTIVALVLGIGGSRVLSVLTPHTQTDIEKLVAARMDNSTLQRTQPERFKGI
jgi:hypothetical protein